LIRLVPRTATNVKFDDEADANVSVDQVGSKDSDRDQRILFRVVVLVSVDQVGSKDSDPISGR